MLSIVIPAYNEEKRLPEALNRMLSYLKKRKLKNEIIIVADKSKDNTLEVVKNYSKKYKNIRYIYNPKKQGKGYAIKKGVLSSKGNLVLFTDADTSTPIIELDNFMPQIKGYDIAIGSREHKDSIVKNKLISRVVLGNLGNILLRLLLIRKIRDTQCGFKLFTRNAAMLLFKKQRIDGGIFDTELIYLTRKFGLKAKEVPVVWVNNPDSKINFIKCVMFDPIDLLKVRLWDFLGKYD